MRPFVAAVVRRVWKLEGDEDGVSSTGETVGRWIPFAVVAVVSWDEEGGGEVVSMAIWGTIVLRRVDLVSSGEQLRAWTFFGSKWRPALSASRTIQTRGTWLNAASSPGCKGQPPPIS